MEPLFVDIGKYGLGQGIGHRLDSVPSQQITQLCRAALLLSGRSCAAPVGCHQPEHAGRTGLLDRRRVALRVSYVLDGADHNNPYDNLNLPLPFPDALQEFKAETSALTAQNGMHSGAAVNAVTKSGTNQFRGDVFEFFRHHSLNATDPFAAKNARRDAEGRRAEAQPVRRDAGRADQDRQGVFLRRISGDEHARQSDRQPRLRSDAGDARRRLHRVRVARLQRRHRRATLAHRSPATWSIRRCSARRR